MHFLTVGSRAQRWRFVERGPHPVEAARETLDVAGMVLTRDPAVGAEFFKRSAEDREQV
jgi:hypothetical protein